VGAVDSRPQNPDIARWLILIEEGGSSNARHRLVVATSGGRDKAVALAVEAFHQPENVGGPRRTIRHVTAEQSPGPIEGDTIIDIELDG
jgi:hypothetical protein